MTVSGAVGAAGALAGAAGYGWEPSMAGMAALAGFAGGLVPDLDADSGRGVRWAGSLVSLMAAASAVHYLMLQNRPPAEWIFAGLVVLAVFNTLGVWCFKALTSHRGMFHSIPTVAAYGAILTAVFAGLGPEAAIGIGLIGAAGALSHLLLDAVWSFKLNPLKLSSKHAWPTVLAWIAACGGLALAWLRLAKPF